MAALGAALLGGVFLAEGVVTYGLYLRYPGEAVVSCVLGVLLVVVLGATASANHRRSWCREKSPLTQCDPTDHAIRAASVAIVRL